MSRILVTGASGFAGSHLARRLLAEGLPVRLLVRPTSNISDLELSGAEVTAGDITDKSSVAKAMEGVKVVYHIAALFRRAGLPDSAYWDVNLKGTENLLQAALDAGVSRFVHCSTVGVLGHIADPPADEDAPYHPGDIYQITKCEGEKAALRYWEEHDLPVTIVRPAGIYGPGDVRWLKLFRSIYRRKFAMLGDGRTTIHMVYVSDLVDAFRLAADNPNAVGRVYIAGGERYVTLNEFAAAIADALDVPAPRWHLPVKPVHLLSGLCEDLCRSIRIEPPIYRRRIDFFIKSRAFDIARAKTELGYSPKVDLRDGIERTARWYLERGLL
jgi:nucleoside-diphosphate-sugar epimerase